MTLTNTGQARYYASVTELGAAADFEMVRGCSSARPMEVIIGGGSSCTLTVSFTPHAPGPSVAQLRFVSELGEAQDLTLVGAGNPVDEPEDPADPTDPTDPGRPDTTAPTVRITKVTVRPARRTVRVAFVGTDDVSTRSDLRYRCRVDRGATRPCTSPLTFRRLKAGRHVVRVRAVDAAGNTGPAAVARFRLRR